MKVEKAKTETYMITDVEKLDPVTVYVQNYGHGRGKVVIQCCEKCWCHYWGAMGENTVQQFIATSDNAYLINKFAGNTRVTDFDEIQRLAAKKGVYISAQNDVEVAMCADDMVDAFGTEWYMDLPQCQSSEYHYLDRIVNVVKQAFKEEISTTNTTGI